MSVDGLVGDEGRQALSPTMEFLVNSGVKMEHSVDVARLVDSDPRGSQTVQVLRGLGLVDEFKGAENEKRVGCNFGSMQLHAELKFTLRGHAASSHKQDGIPIDRLEKFATESVISHLGLQHIPKGTTLRLRGFKQKANKQITFFGTLELELLPNATLGGAQGFLADFEKNKEDLLRELETCFQTKTKVRILDRTKLLSDRPDSHPEVHTVDISMFPIRVRGRQELRAVKLGITKLQEMDIQLDEMIREQEGKLKELFASSDSALSKERASSVGSSGSASLSGSMAFVQTALFLQGDEIGKAGIITNKQQGMVVHGPMDTEVDIPAEFDNVAPGETNLARGTALQRNQVYVHTGKGNQLSLFVVGDPESERPLSDVETVAPLSRTSTSDGGNSSAGSRGYVARQHTKQRRLLRKKEWEGIAKAAAAGEVGPNKDPSGQLGGVLAQKALAFIQNRSIDDQIKERLGGLDNIVVAETKVLLPISEPVHSAGKPPPGRVLPIAHGYVGAKFIKPWRPDSFALSKVLHLANLKKTSLRSLEHSEKISNCNARYVKYFCKRYSRHYYFDRVTGKVQWYKNETGKVIDSAELGLKNDKTEAVNAILDISGGASNTKAKRDALTSPDLLKQSPLDQSNKSGAAQMPHAGGFPKHANDLSQDTAYVGRSPISQQHKVSPVSISPLQRLGSSSGPSSGPAQNILPAQGRGKVLALGPGSGPHLGQMSGINSSPGPGSHGVVSLPGQQQQQQQQQRQQQQQQQQQHGMAGPHGAVLPFHPTHPGASLQGQGQGQGQGQVSNMIPGMGLRGVPSMQGIPNAGLPGHGMPGILPSTHVFQSNLGPLGVGRGGEEGSSSQPHDLLGPPPGLIQALTHAKKTASGNGKRQRQATGDSFQSTSSTETKALKSRISAQDIFYDEHRTLLKAENPHLNPGEIEKQLSEKWKKINAEMRLPFRIRANAARESTESKAGQRNTTNPTDGKALGRAASKPTYPTLENPPRKVPRTSSSSRPSPGGLQAQGFTERGQKVNSGIFPTDHQRMLRSPLDRGHPEASHQVHLKLQQQQQQHHQNLLRQQQELQLLQQQQQQEHQLLRQRLIQQQQQQQQQQRDMQLASQVKAKETKESLMKQIMQNDAMRAARAEMAREPAENLVQYYMMHPEQQRLSLEQQRNSLHEQQVQQQRQRQQQQQQQQQQLQQQHIAAYLELEQRKQEDLQRRQLEDALLKQELRGYEMKNQRAEEPSRPAHHSDLLAGRGMVHGFPSRKTGSSWHQGYGPAPDVQRQHAPAPSGRFANTDTNKEAAGFLTMVQRAFPNQPEVYRNFLRVMEEFSTAHRSSSDVVRIVMTLFKDKPELLSAFEEFL